MEYDGFDLKKGDKYNWFFIAGGDDLCFEAKMI